MIVDGREISAFEDVEGRITRGRLGFRLLKSGEIELRNIKIKKLTGQSRSTRKTASPAAKNKTRLVPLFNGKNKSGWSEDARNQGTWEVTDGVLVGRGGSDGPAVLMTGRSDFANFRLRLRFSSPDDTSKQVWIRHRFSDSQNTSRGYGVSVGGNTDSLEKTVPVGSITKVVDRQSRGLIDWGVLAEPTPTAVNEWQTIEITALDHRIMTSVNGVQVARFVDQNEYYKTGAIALVCRGKSEIRYGEISIEELNAVPVRDALQTGSTWNGELLRIQNDSRETHPVTFTIFERNGDRFKARFETFNQDREIYGTIKEGRISWLANDVRVIDGKGHQGQDHSGVIQGDNISLKYSGTAVANGEPVWGTVSLQRVPSLR